MSSNSYHTMSHHGMDVDGDDCWWLNQKELHNDSSNGSSTSWRETSTGRHVGTAGYLWLVDSRLSSLEEALLPYQF
jgi:hypothetical protein